MKAIFKSIFMLAATLSLAACSDVPSPYDIPGGNTTPTTTDYINETFATSFGVFTAKTVKGTAWAIDYSTAKATGYDSKATTTTASDGYIVSAPVDLSKSTAANITFSYILRYYTKNGTAVPGVKNQVLITDNYTGDPSTTTWTDITGTLTEGADWTTFSTYKANIPSAFIGKNKIVVALRYACESSSSTWEVKNFVMKEGSVDDTPVTPPTPTGDATITKAGNVVTIVNSKATESENKITCDLNTSGFTDKADPTLVTLSDGTTVSFAQETGSNAPKYYMSSKGVRMYALNSMTITGSKAIAKMVLTCDVYNGLNEVGNDQLYTKITGNIWKTVNDFTGTSGGTQLRVQTIEITYAK